MLKDIDEIYFWAPELSPHTLPLFEAVRKKVKATYISQATLGSHRVALGWVLDYDQGDVGIILAPSPSEVAAIVAASSRKSLHIFIGIHWVDCIVNGLQSVVANKRRFGILSEPRVAEGVAGVARLFHSWLTEGAVRANCDFVLAIGAHGPSWFRLAGYRSDKIHPFAYFLNAPDGVSETGRKSLPGRIKVGFLGRQIPMKGFDLLLGAMPYFDSCVDVVVAGTGVFDAKIAETMERFPGRFSSLGVLPMSKVSTFLADVDILVCPSISKDDGWGVVVSEALMCGASVLVSEKVGASICAFGINGRRLRSLSSASIGFAVNEIVSCGELEPHFRNKRKDWARKNLSVEVAFALLSNILTGGRNEWPSN